MEMSPFNPVLANLVSRKQMNFQSTKAKSRQDPSKKLESSCEDNKYKWNLKNGPEQFTTRRERLVQQSNVRKQRKIRSYRKK